MADMDDHRNYRGIFSIVFGPPKKIGLHLVQFNLSPRAPGEAGRWRESVGGGGVGRV